MSDTWEPTATPVAYHTQKIGNQLPYWHAGRRVIASRTQRVLNAAAGFHMDTFMSQVRLLRANGHLATADVCEPHMVWVCRRPIAVRSHEDVRNMLQNPGFHRVQPWRLGAWGWGRSLSAGTGEISLRPGRGLFGYYGIRLTAEVGETISLHQRLVRPMNVHENFLVSCWYAGMRPASSFAGPQVDGPKILVTLTYVDNTTEDFQEFLNPATDGTWTQASLLITPSKVVHSVDVKAVVEDVDGETAVMEFGGFQMELGTLPTPWTEDLTGARNLYLLYEKDNYTESTDWGDITYDRQTRIAIADNVDYAALSYVTTPSRATVVAADDDEVGVAHTVLGAEVDQAGVQFSVGWRVNSGVIERYNADLSQSEVWYSLGVADLFADGTFDETYRDPADEAVTQVIEAITVARHWLYIVVKETWKGRTNRILKVCNPYVRWKDTGFLESLQDIWLDSGTGTCTGIGLMDERIDKILYTVDGTDYVGTLFWDKAAGTQDGMVVLRSDPGEGVLVA